MNTGVIESLWRFPVKSMQGERIETAEFNAQGIVGDRGYALIDNSTGKVVSAKSVKQFPDILMCRAEYAEEPKTGVELPPVIISLDNGTIVRSDNENIDEILSGYFGRDVTLAVKAPDDFTIDVFYPDIENLHPAGMRNTSGEEKLGAALFKEMGADSPVTPESFKDVYPVSLITTSTLDYLNELNPETNFDARRFRMNVIVRAIETGFAENSWVGKTVKIGNVPLSITMPDPRCVMTSLAQNGFPRDNNVLKTLVAHNRQDIMGTGKFPCAGVYAVVGTPGVVKVTDPVELIE